MSGAAWGWRRRVRRLRRRRRLLTIAALALVIGGSIGYLAWSGAPATGRPAPPFVLPDSEGRPVALANHLGRRAIVLIFYMSNGRAGCRAQLGKLRPELGRIRELGAEVMAISSDRTEDAQRMARELEFALPVLSDPKLDVIYSYSMKGPHSMTADMGYVLIDPAGRIRTRQVDHRFGEHAGEIIQGLERIVRVGGSRG